MDITSFLIGYKSGAANVTPELQEKTVTPGESAIEVIPDDGYDGLSKVIVEAMASGGGSAVVTTGTVRGAGGATTITHNLGCVPDFFVIVDRNSVEGASFLILALGCSSALKSKYSIDVSFISQSMWNGTPFPSASTATIETATGKALYSANATTIGVGGSGLNALYSGHTYCWYAIGGLT